MDRATTGASPSATPAAFAALLDAADAARTHFNSLPETLERDDPAAHVREMDCLVAASRAADRAEPTNWSEFVRLLENMTDNGHSVLDEDNAERVLLHARRLASDANAKREG